MYRSADATGKRTTQSTSERGMGGLTDASGHSLSGRESLEQPTTPPAVHSSTPAVPLAPVTQYRPPEMSFLQVIAPFVALFPSHDLHCSDAQGMPDRLITERGRATAGTALILVAYDRQLLNVPQASW